MWNRIYALFVARNLEFVRDRSALAWSVLLPVLIIFVFAFAFTDDNPEKFKVGLISGSTIAGAAATFSDTRYIRFIEFDEVETSLQKVERHQVDLLFDPDSKRYWINQTSPNGYIVEKLLIAAYADSAESLQKILVEGDEIRYIDWVIPGVIAMNIMWGALFLSQVRRTQTSERDPGHRGRIFMCTDTVAPVVAAGGEYRDLHRHGFVCRLSHAWILFQPVTRVYPRLHQFNLLRPSGRGAHFQRRSRQWSFEPV